MQEGLSSYEAYIIGLLHLNGLFFMCLHKFYHI